MFQMLSHCRMDLFLVMLLLSSLSSPDIYRVARLRLRKWAHVLLTRVAEIFGQEFVKERLKQKRQVATLFSGIDCPRMAWDAIAKAAHEMWGITCGVKFVFAATQLIICC